MGKKKSASLSQSKFVNASSGSKLSIAEAETLVCNLEGKKKTYTYLPGGDLEANRLRAINFFTYQSNRLVDSITGETLTKQERNSVISSGKKGKVFSYVPDGKTETAEAVSYSFYQSNKIVNAMTGKLLSKNERASLLSTNFDNMYSFLPDDQEDIEENRLFAVKYYIYKNSKLVNAVTGKPLSEFERATRTLVPSNSKAYSYVPDGATDIEENRLIAVSSQYYQTYLPLDAFTGKSLSTTERMSIAYDLESNFYSYLPDGHNDTPDNRIPTISYLDYKRYHLVNAVTGEALTDKEKASVITADDNTSLYLPEGKEDLPTNRCVALNKNVFDSELNKKIFGQDGYKIQRLSNTQGVLIVFSDKQWEVASRHFTAIFISTINRKCRLAKCIQNTDEKADFQLVMCDNLTNLVLHNPIFVLNSNINFPVEAEWLPVIEEANDKSILEHQTEATINPCESNIDNLINSAESVYGFFNSSTIDKETRIHERSWDSDEELPTKRRRT